jgi:hypothetical protein
MTLSLLFFFFLLVAFHLYIMLCRKRETSVYVTLLGEMECDLRISQTAFMTWISFIFSFVLSPLP